MGDHRRQSPRHGRRCDRFWLDRETERYGRPRIHDRAHGHARPATGQRSADLESAEGALPRPPHHLGRQFREPLPEARSEFAIRRLAGARAGGRQLPRASRSDRGKARSHQHRRNRLSPARRFIPYRARAHLAWTRRAARSALRQDLCRPIFAPDNSGASVRRLPGLDRMPVRVQFLRCDLGLWPARKGAVVRANGRASRFPRKRARNGFGPFLRQQFLS